MQIVSVAGVCGGYFVKKKRKNAMLRGEILGVLLHNDYFCRIEDGNLIN